MLLTLATEHKKCLLLLAEYSHQVLQDFCKLVLDYVRKGPSFKLYSVAAHKLEVTPEDIRDRVESLVYLLAECCKYKLTDKDFTELVASLGFTDEKEAVLSKSYTVLKKELLNALSASSLKLQRYHNLEWRFEVEVAKRSCLDQATPLITLDLALKNIEDSDKVEHVLLQTDPNNLLHLAQELEGAMQVCRGHRIRRYIRTMK
ncbi:COMM domain-containing protein 2-like isoform X1 [Orussus abietinus]|uniref:COMM domain-containing protein 2-like isoform X1 n=1 Tax=Orussus abietinus TaxID=222816 RepID=UPI000625D59F|nr:COMM domain-containing protein 2-like isoform X1 [Orussus abietinus]